MSQISLQTRDVAVFGLGVSGLSTISWLAKEGIFTRCCDDNDSTPLRSQADALGAVWTTLEEGLLSNASFLVLSPGIPCSHKVAVEAQKKNIPIICDIEIFAQKYDSATIIAVTGTNGKSTLTHLITHILNNIGTNAIAAGNYGTPILDVDMSKNPVAVLELSSYQLERSPSIAPNTSIITNITPDHLDRYGGSFEEYQKAKIRLFKQTKKVGLIILDNAISELPLVQDTLKLRIDDTLQLKLESPTRCSNGDYAINILPDLPLLIDSSSSLGGMVGGRLLNFALASVASINPDYFIDLKNNFEELQRAIDSFEPLPHRQEIVFKTDQLLVVNDSKATNPEACIVALERFDNILWLAGGLDKNTSLSAISPYLDKIQSAYLFGDAAPRIESFLKNYSNSIRILKCQSLEEATNEALNDALLGSDKYTILLSPLCASFDQFDSFSHRGDTFKQIIMSRLDNNS